jgi:phosphatidylinositol 3-kinase
MSTTNPPTQEEQTKIIDTYIRSCAGYAVVTYLLAIGDRHLENLMVTEKGNMFHLDFGFIFGSDPHPFQPLIRHNKDMVAAMGGD